MQETHYHNGKKVVTHVVPSGIAHDNVKCIIGAECVVSPKLLLEEIEQLEKAGINVDGKLFVDNRATIITGEHLAEDGLDKAIGTTKKGTGPAYRDKYNRKAMRMGDHRFPDSRIKIIDSYKEFFVDNTDVVALFQGGQGFYLDITHGDYPYVTSSHCTTAGAMLNGVPPKAIRKVYGVAKAYETYVGAKKFEPDEEIFKKIREVGQEFGATTGRPRQCNWMDINNLIKAIEINGVTDVIINKMDILQQVNQWKIIDNGKVTDCKEEETFKQYIRSSLVRTGCKNIVFSYSPLDI